MKSHFYIMMAGIIIFCINFSQANSLHTGSVDFRGNSTFNSDTLLSLMELKPSVLFWTTPFTKFKLEGDVQAIDIFYRTRGFLFPKITSAIKIDSSGNRVDITITISEGSRVKVTSVSLSQNDVFNNYNLSSLKSTPGEPLNYNFLNFDARWLTDRLTEKGYLKALVAPALMIDSAAYTASIVYSVKPGPRILVKDVSIAGLSTVASVVVTRELTFKPGDVLTSEEISKTERKLFLTRMFNFLEITALIGDSAYLLPPGDTAVPVIISVNQADYFSIEAGIGYGSYERLYLTLLLSYSNLFHQGHTIALNSNLSGFDQRTELVYTVPWIFMIPFQLSASAYYERHDTLLFSIPLGYEGEFRGFTLSVGRPFNERLSFNFAFDYEDVLRISVPNPDSLPGSVPRKNTRSILGNLSYDRRNNVFNPSKGFWNQFTLQVAGIGGASYNQFVKFANDIRWYYTFSNNMLLSAGVVIGWESAYGASLNVPAQDQFYAGGPQSVRGFKLNELITTPSGNPKGGNVELILHVFDLQFPLFWLFYGAVFSDAGYIWQDIQSVNFSDLKITAGPALRLRTPIGMLRVDVGFQLQNLGQKDSYQINFEIGRPF